MRPAKLSTSIAVVLLVLLAPSALHSAEVDGERLDRCRRVTDSLERLVCFDALASGKEVPLTAVSASQKPAAPSYRRVTLTDLQVDAAELRGKRIEATGLLQQLGEMVILKDEMLSMNGVFVEIGAVPRDERRRIFERCSQGCTAIVRGVGAAVMANSGIKADRVEIP